MRCDYALALVKSQFLKPNPTTFEEDLQHRVGEKLYQALFRPIASKLWGEPRELDVKLSRSRVQTPKISEIIARMLKIRQKSQFEALEFDYPLNGLSEIWNAIEAKNATHKTGEFFLQHKVIEISGDDSHISRIVCMKMETNEIVGYDVGKEDMVFSTLPLSILSKAIKPAVSESMTKLINDSIILNDLLLVFLYLDTPSLLSDSWIFVPDPKIAFHRVSEQKSFDPGMTPHGTIVCCEIMNNSLRPMAAKNDSELCQLAVLGLQQMGYNDIPLIDQKVIRLTASYPVFRPGFEDSLSIILDELDRFENFRTIGRQGAFNYIRHP